MLERDGGAADARDGLNGFGDVSGAITASHSLDFEVRHNGRLSDEPPFVELAVAASVDACGGGGGFLATH